MGLDIEWDSQAYLGPSAGLKTCACQQAMYEGCVAKLPSDKDHTGALEAVSSLE